MKTKHGKRRLERRGGGDGRRGEEIGGEEIGGEEIGGEEIGGEEIGGKEESENYRISQKLVLWRTIIMRRVGSWRMYRYRSLQL